MLELLVVDDEIVILQGIVKLIKEGKTPFTHIESERMPMKRLNCWSIPKWI